jgi:hypothetical protein
MPEQALSTGESVDFTAFTDKEFVIGGVILPEPFGGGAEILK